MRDPCRFLRKRSNVTQCRTLLRIGVWGVKNAERKGDWDSWDTQVCEKAAAKRSDRGTASSITLLFLAECCTFENFPLSPPFCPAAFEFMASDDLDIPQIAVVGAPDDNTPSSSASAVPSPTLDSSRLPPSPSATDNFAYLSPITPILRSARNSLDPLGSDNSSLPPPPSPTLSAHSGSVRWANSTVLRDNNPEEHDGSSSLYLAPPPQGHRRKSSVGTVSGDALSF
jgi:hypothetical protein